MDWKDIGKTIAKIGAPLLGNAILPGIGGVAASAIVASALGVEDTPDAIDVAIRTDPEAALKLRTAELENARDLRSLVLQAESKQIAETNQSYRAELVSGNWYQKGWRPTFGYGTAISYTSQMMALSYVIVTEPEKAPAVIAAMAAMTALWGIGLAVVGVAVWKRSDDKAIAAGGEKGFGILSAVAKRIGGS